MLALMPPPLLVWSVPCAATRPAAGCPSPPARWAPSTTTILTTQVLLAPGNSCPLLSISPGTCGCGWLVCSLAMLCSQPPATPQPQPCHVLRPHSSHPIPRHPTLPTFHSTPACPAVAPLSWDIVPEYDFFSEFATCEDEWATNNLAWFNTTTQACQMQPAGLLPNSFWNSGGFTSFTGIQVGGETVTGRPVDWSRAGRSCSCGELRRARTDHDPVAPP